MTIMTTTPTDPEVVHEATYTSVLDATEAIHALVTLGFPFTLVAGWVDDGAGGEHFEYEIKATRDQ